MKYKCTNEVIPQKMREDINTKIEYIVNNDLPEAETGISKDDIFNAYTGLGGLHGLEFNNYDSYYDYQRAKADIEQGQFFTPYKLVESNFYGCELDGKPYRVAKHLYPDAKLENTDIRFL